MLRFTKLYFPIFLCSKSDFGVGHCSIVDKSSAYGAKGPWFKTWWRKKIYLCHCVFICSVKKIVIKNKQGNCHIKLNVKLPALKSLTGCLHIFVTASNIPCFPRSFWTNLEWAHSNLLACNFYQLQNKI